MSKGTDLLPSSATNEPRSSPNGGNSTHCTRDCSLLLICQLLQVGTITVLLQFVSLGEKLRFGQPALVVGNLFQTGNSIALALLNGFHKLRGFQQAFMGAGIQPGETAAQQFYVQSVLF